MEPNKNGPPASSQSHLQCCKDGRCEWAEQTGRTEQIFKNPNPYFQRSNVLFRKVITTTFCREPWQKWQICDYGCKNWPLVEPKNTQNTWKAVQNTILQFVNYVNTNGSNTHKNILQSYTMNLYPINRKERIQRIMACVQTWRAWRGFQGSDFLFLAAGEWLNDFSLSIQWYVGQNYNWHE